jgi:hypothetical protein
MPMGMQDTIIYSIVKDANTVKDGIAKFFGIFKNIQDIGDPTNEPIG